MPPKHIAVIDIGKTNKKVLIFDERLQIVDKAYRTFDEIVEENIHYEPIDDMTEWIKDQLRIFAATYSIKAISVTTHGATAMCIGRDGSLAVPPVAYTSDAGEEFRTEFYEKFGNREHLQAETATAEVGSLINLGKLIYFVQKRYPEHFANVTSILNYPQYWGFVLTGKLGAEPTYTGCHTYLFDFDKKRYSDVARKLGIVDKLPPRIAKSWEVLGTVSPSIAKETGLSVDCVVTMGIHDSNSSLLPYLVKGHKNFVLNSTGTWCVAMHPTGKVHFQPDELGKLVFYNLDAFHNPVKTSIFMGGLEFEMYSGLIKKICGRDDFPTYDHALYERIISEHRLFIVPSVVKGTGIFPDAQPRAIENGVAYHLGGIQSGERVPSFFRDFEAAHAVLAASLAIQTRVAMQIAGFKGDGTVFTEGGFRRNDRYNRLLASLLPESTCALTKLEEATAFGAAILAKAALDGTSPNETKDLFEIEQVEVKSERFVGLEAYAEEFVGRI